MSNEVGIARLRKSKEMSGERLRGSWRAQGKEWALNDAEYEQLERVARLAEGLREGIVPGAMFWLAVANGKNEIGAVLAEELFSGGWPSDDQVEGFIEGAADVFAQV